MAEPYTIDAGGIFARTKEVYADLVEQEEKAEEAVREARAMVYDAEQSPRAADYGEQLAQAKELLAKAELLLPEIRRVRLNALMRTVNNLGSTLARVKAARANIELGEEGFGPQFDADLANITARYQSVYRPLFPVGPGGQVQVPDPAAMTEQEWELLHQRAEGPIFFWDYNQCQAEWKVAGVPPCTGPDYLHALSLVNQVFVAWENQIEIRDEFPIIGFVDTVLGGKLEEAGGVVRETEDIATDIYELLKALLEITKKAAKGLASLPAWVLIGGGVAAFFLLRGGKR